MYSFITYISLNNTSLEFIKNIAILYIAKKFVQLNTMFLWSVHIVVYNFIFSDGYYRTYYATT